MTVMVVMRARRRRHLRNRQCPRPHIGRSHLTHYETQPRQLTIKVLQCNGVRCTMTVRRILARYGATVAAL